MTRNQRQTLGIVLVVGLLAFIWWAVKSRDTKAAADAAAAAAKVQPKIKTRAIVVARKDIEKRKEITKDMVVVKEVDEKFVPRKGAAEKLEDVVNKVTLTPIYAGEMMMEKRFASRASLQALSFLIKKGKRAVSIEVKTENAVAGFLKKGNYVDVNVTLRKPGKERQEQFTETILQGVKIIAVNTSVDVGGKTPEKKNPKKKDEKDGPSAAHRAVGVGVVTLELTPAQVEKLVLAKLVAKEVQLALRSGLDPPPDTDAGVEKNSNMVDAYKIFADAQAQTTPRENKADVLEPSKIQMIRGRAKRVMTIE